MEEWFNLAEKEPQRAADWLKKKGIDIPTLMAEEALTYKSELVSLVKRP